MQNPSHLYALAGTYTVKLVVTNSAGCPDSISIPVVIFNRPTAAFSYFSTYCPAGKVTFTDQSTAAGAPVNNWYWVFEPGFFSAAANPVYTFSTLGASYPISLIIHDMNGCADTIDSTIYVKPGFAFTFTANTTCLGDSTHFQPVNLATGDSLHELRWTFGEASSGMNNTSSRYQPAHKYANPNTYTVKLKAYNSDNCSDSVFKEVTVHPLPVAAFASNSIPCDTLVHFTDNSASGSGTISTWKWTWGDASVPVVINAPWPGDTSHVYPGEGAYPVNLVVTDSHGCKDSVIRQVNVSCITSSFVQFATDLNCSNDSVTFYDHSAPVNKIDQWYWQFGDNTDSTYNTLRSSIRHKYNPGNYTVKLTIRSFVGSDTIVAVHDTAIVVNIGPTSDFTATRVCSGDSTGFTDLANDNTVPINSREWKFGDGSSVIYLDTVVNPVHKYLNWGTFQTKFIVENTIGCKDSVTKPVIVSKLPQAALSNSKPCERYDIQFLDQSVPGDTSLVKWWWNLGDPMRQYDTLFTRNVMSRFDSAGTYLVYLKVQDNYGCTDTVYTPVTILPSPIAAFTITENIDGRQGKIRLNNESSDDAKGFKWIFGNGKTSTEINPVVTYTSDTQPYTIELITWNTALCYDTTLLTYEFMFDNLFVPNAFSPSNLNGSLGCREFKPKGMNLKDYHVMVFDKWGHLLWESKLLTDDGKGMPAQGWDGTFNGEPLMQDVYMWKISATFKNGKSWEGSDTGKGSTTNMGTVTLIR